ncbi:MAG TPA: FlgD immunoglobulin-like domain containing protein, partial [Candidatus Kapabacteria bacterium]|nr:FlgD immunoglobulin-like domain containing protein [Candidatus Kapabacteria bacterium]
SQNVPNPMSSTTRISFAVSESQNVTVEISDVYGKTVRTFVVEAKSGDANGIEWDGRDANGVTVPNGAYVYKLIGNGFTLARKMTITR